MTKALIVYNNHIQAKENIFYSVACKAYDEVRKYDMHRDIRFVRGNSYDKVFLFDIKLDELSTEYRNVFEATLHTTNGTIQEIDSDKLFKDEIKDETAFKIEVPTIATVYRYRGNIHITIRHCTDMESYDCSDLRHIRGCSFNEIYVLNMEIDDLPEQLKNTLYLCMASKQGTMRSLYFKQD